MADPRYDEEEDEGYEAPTTVSRSRTSSQALKRDKGGAARKMRKTLSGGLKDVSRSPYLGMAGPGEMPLRAALAGASGAIGAETESFEDVGIYGKVVPPAVAAVDEVIGLGSEMVEEKVAVGEAAYDLASRVMFGSGVREAKAAKREQEESHAHGTAGKATDDPASGTRQGASQRYTGTGDTQSRTGETGGVTTGAPGQIRVGLPGGEGMVDYDPDDPSVREAFEQIDDRFMEHSERAAPTRPGQIDRKGGPDSVLKRNLAAQGGKIVGPPSGTGQGVSYTIGGDIPEATQIESWDTFLKMQEAEQQTFRTGMAKSEAEEAQAGAEQVRSEMLTEQPFRVEDTAASAKIGVAEIEAATEVAGRTEVKAIVAEAAEKINEMRQDARFRSMPPEEQKRLEDQIWEQARLTLSGLAETPLYPRVDPYAMFAGMSRPTAEEKK